MGINTRHYFRSSRRNNSNQTNTALCRLKLSSLFINQLISEFGFPLSVSFYQCSTSFLWCPTLISICMLVLLQIQTGEAWEASKKQRSFQNRDILDRKAPSICSTISTLPMLHSRLYLHATLINTNDRSSRNLKRSFGNRTER
jgi:hypothetical protein